MGNGTGGRRAEGARSTVAVTLWLGGSYTVNDGVIVSTT